MKRLFLFLIIGALLTASAFAGPKVAWVINYGWRDRVLGPGTADEPVPIRFEDMIWSLVYSETDFSTKSEDFQYDETSQQLVSKTAPSIKFTYAEDFSKAPVTVGTITTYKHLSGEGIIPLATRYVDASSTTEDKGPCFQVNHIVDGHTKSGDIGYLDQYFVAQELTEGTYKGYELPYTTGYLYQMVFGTTADRTTVYWTVAGSTNSTSGFKFKNITDSITPEEDFWMTSNGGKWDEAVDWMGHYAVATPIPEPATMSLLGLGALALVLRRRTRP